MLTVQQVADKYGVSVAFMLAALAKVGFHATGADTPLSPPIVNQFAATWATRIHMNRPKQPTEFQGVSETALPPAALAARAAGTPPKHVMRVAHARITGGRDPQGNKVKMLIDNPGPLHALDAAGTWDGDPWRGVVVPGAVHYYGGGPNSGPRAACGWVHVRAVLGEEFVPAEEPERAGQCPACAGSVAQGKGWRTPPREREMRRPCDDDLRLVIDGKHVVEFCALRDFHVGRHRTDKGASWLLGFEDFKPAMGVDIRRVKKDA